MQHEGIHFKYRAGVRVRTNQLDKHSGHSGKGARPLLFAAVNMEVSHINTNMQLVDELC